MFFFYSFPFCISLLSMCECVNAPCVLCRLTQSTSCTKPQSFLILTLVESVVCLCVCVSVYLIWLHRNCVILRIVRHHSGWKWSMACVWFYTIHASSFQSACWCVCVPFHLCFPLCVTWFPVQVQMDTPTPHLTLLFHQLWMLMPCWGRRDSPVAPPTSWSSMLQQTQQLWVLPALMPNASVVCLLLSHTYHICICMYIQCI